MASSMPMMRSSGIHGPPPKDRDVFQLADSDGDALVSQTELGAVAEGIEEITGTTINVDEALSNFDVNQDGGLSGEELLQMMTSYGFAPPEMGAGDQRDSAMKPPPPVEQALSVYGQNSGDDTVAQLLELLQNQDSDEGYTSIDVSS